MGPWVLPKKQNSPPQSQNNIIITLDRSGRYIRAIHLSFLHHNYNRNSSDDVKLLFNYNCSMILCFACYLFQLLSQSEIPQGPRWAPKKTVVGWPWLNIRCPLSSSITPLPNTTRWGENKSTALWGLLWGEIISSHQKAEISQLSYCIHSLCPKLFVWSLWTDLIGTFGVSALPDGTAETVLFRGNLFPRMAQGWWTRDWFGLLWL